MRESLDCSEEGRWSLVEMWSEVLSTTHDLNPEFEVRVGCVDVGLLKGLLESLTLEVGILDDVGVELEEYDVSKLWLGSTKVWLCWDVFVLLVDSLVPGLELVDNGVDLFWRDLIFEQVWEEVVLEDVCVGVNCPIVDVGFLWVTAVETVLLGKQDQDGSSLVEDTTLLINPDGDRAAWELSTLLHLLELSLSKADVLIIDLGQGKEHPDWLSSSIALEVVELWLATSTTDLTGDGITWLVWSPGELAWGDACRWSVISCAAGSHIFFLIV